MIDNTSAVSQINNMGTCHIEECNSFAVQIWEFCVSHNITWLTAAHIPGSPMWLQMVNLDIFIPKILNGCSTLNCWLGPSRPLIFNQRLIYLILVWIGNCLIWVLYWITFAKVHLYQYFEWPVEFLAYPEDESLCVVKTRVLRNDCCQLLLSHVTPHGLASKDTISRWC